MCLSYWFCGGKPDRAFIAIAGYIEGGIDFGLDFDVPLIGR